MKSHFSNSIEQTQIIAANWLADIAKTHSQRDEALVIGLSGHLGSGKTAFVKALAKELGIKEEITSPTFVIMKIFDTVNEVFPRLIHIDAYRLERREELEAIQWEKLVSDKKNLIMIEWPENVGLRGFVKGADLKLEIKEGAHVITIS